MSLKARVLCSALAILIAAGCIIFGKTRPANAEIPQFAPVNVWVGPIVANTHAKTTYSFNVFMSSQTKEPVRKSTAVNIMSCNGQPLKMSRTRHLAGGETLVPLKGGPDGSTEIRWVRPMGVPGSARPAKLRVSFIGLAPAGTLCLYIWDASSLAGGSYTLIQQGMK